MNKTVLKYLLLVISVTFFNSNSYSQIVSYRKDSLQIKTYSEITYKNSKVVGLKVTRVLCDYCDENQKAAITQQAWHRSYLDRYSPRNKMLNGKRKLALFIRISKKDFANLKQPKTN